MGICFGYIVAVDDGGRIDRINGMDGLLRICLNDALLLLFHDFVLLVIDFDMLMNEMRNIAC